MRRKTLFQIAEIANGLVDPILAKLAGINTMLLGSWEDIAGPEFADCTKPEKIVWQRRASEGQADGGFEPGTLVVACEGARALFLSHQLGEFIDRINGFFGFPAVQRIKIVQKPVTPLNRPKRRALPLPQDKAQHLSKMLGDIEDDRLKAALEKLGRAVMTQKKHG